MTNPTVLEFVITVLAFSITIILFLVEMSKMTKNYNNTINYYRETERRLTRIISTMEYNECGEEKAIEILKRKGMIK